MRICAVRATGSVVKTDTYIHIRHVEVSLDLAVSAWRCDCV